MERKRTNLHILVISDCELVRAGLCLLLKTMPPISIAEEASTSESLKAAMQQHFDVLVYDIDQHYGNWPSLLRDLHAKIPASPLVAVTDCQERDHIRAAYECGALAVVLKRQPPITLLTAIQTVAGGDVWLHRPLFASMLQPNGPSPVDGPTSSEESKIMSLTKREREIIQTIAKGYRNKQIADALCLSEATVRHHLTSIFSKLGLSDRLELLIYAQKHGLVEIGTLGGHSNKSIV